MKHVQTSRSLAVVFAFGTVAAAFAFGPMSGTRAVAQTPASGTPASGVPVAPAPAASVAPGATPIVAVTATPGPSPSAPATKEPRQRRSRLATPSPGPSPTDTPTSPAFATLDGSWEVQLQTQSTTSYSYLDIKQTQNGISGTWRQNRDRDKYPFDGTYDGRLIRIVAKGPSGDVILSGYVDGASDMVGTVDYGKGDPVAFTAEHRASNKGGGLLQKIAPPGVNPAGGGH